MVIPFLSLRVKSLELRHDFLFSEFDLFAILDFRLISVPRPTFGDLCIGDLAGIELYRKSLPLFSFSTGGDYGDTRISVYSESPLGGFFNFYVSLPFG